MGNMWRPQRHESHEMGPGIPDLSFVMRGGEFETGWMELKVVKKLGGKIAHFKKAQEQWLLEHHRLGVPTFLLIYSIKEDDWYWFQGEAIGKVQGSTKEELISLAAHTGQTGSVEFLKKHTTKRG